MQNSNNVEIADKKSLFFTKPWLALRRMAEKLSFIWTSPSPSGSKSRGYTKDVTVPPRLQLPSLPISKKDLLGSCWFKWGNISSHCPHWYSLRTKAFSIHCHLLFQVWRAQTRLRTKGSRRWSLLCVPTPRTQSPLTIPRYICPVEGIQTRDFD